MPATITNATRVHSAISFIENLSGPENVYMFAGKIDAWDDENDPSLVVSNSNNLRDTLSSIIFAKKISSVDGILGLKRYNWSTGTVYTPWAHDIDLSNSVNWLGLEQPFYVFVLDNEGDETKYSVFMCIDNNGGIPSTEKPYGQNTNAFVLDDGYKWKYMYDIKTELLEYLSTAFIPCPYKDTDKTTEHLTAQDGVSQGTVDRIRIENGGIGYTALNTSVTITGDGTEASATLEFDESGTITKVIVTNPGSGYTYVNAIITGDGSDAEVTPVMSPIRGHGSTAHSQLCASHAMIKQGFIHDEGGLFPTQNSYRTIGLIKDLKDNDGVNMTDDKYNFFHEIQCVNITSQFPVAQKIIGKSSGATALIFSQDPPAGASNASFFIVDKRGTFQLNETIELEGNPSTLAVITSIINNITDIAVGNIIYHENVQFVTRKTGQTEKFIFSIEF